MRFVATERAGDGARLAMDVYGGLNGTVPLLRVGVALSSRYRQALLDAGIRRILVADDESAGITVTTQLSEETRKRATSLLRPLLERSQRQIARGERVPRETVRSASAVAAVVSGEVLEMSDGVVTFADGFGPGGYSLQHPIDVTALSEHAGQVLSREQLLDLVWGSTYDVTDDQVKTYIGYLRRKIGDDAVDSQLIETVRGFGYRYRRQT